MKRTHGPLGIAACCLIATLACPFLAGAQAAAAPATLCAAAKNGDLVSLKKGIAQGQDVNARGGDGLAPLDLAALRGDAEACRLLLTAGADPRAVDAVGMTPLHEAAYSGKAEVVQLLIGKGAPVDLPDRAGLTPLHYAAAGGNLQVVTILLTSGADLHAKTQEGLTPKALAAKSRQQAASEFLQARETAQAPPAPASGAKAAPSQPAGQPRVYTNEDLEALRTTSRLANEDQLSQAAPGGGSPHPAQGASVGSKQEDRNSSLQEERDRLVRQKRDEEDRLPQLEKDCQQASKAGQGASGNIEPGPGVVVTSTGYETTRGAMRDQMLTCRPLREAQKRIQELDRRISDIDRKMSSGQNQQPPGQNNRPNRKKNQPAGY